jgi:glycosyltransferase involved in cell wall biosynthesis
VIDAAAMKLPTIATKIPGLVDAVEENMTGRLVEMKDAKALEKAMDQLWDDVELRQKMGHAAQERVQKYFSSEKLAEELFSFYREQVGKQQKNPSRN